MEPEFQAYVGPRPFEEKDEAIFSEETVKFEISCPQSLHIVWFSSMPSRVQVRLHLSMPGLFLS